MTNEPAPADETGLPDSLTMLNELAESLGCEQRLDAGLSYADTWQLLLREVREVKGIRLDHGDWINEEYIRRAEQNGDGRG